MQGPDSYLDHHKKKKLLKISRDFKNLLRKSKALQSFNSS